MGFALTSGNSQTKNLDIAFTPDPKTLHDHLGLYTSTLYATNDMPGATPATTANSVQGGIRYDHDFTPRLFAYVSADFRPMPCRLWIFAPFLTTAWVCT